MDWQSLSLGNPLSDVAYFLGAGPIPELRRKVEADTAEEYRGVLQASGIEGYDAQHCWEDYCRGSFSGFAVTVIASVMVEQTERGDEMFTAMARRHARHALDLGGEDLLKT